LPLFFFLINRIYLINALDTEHIKFSNYLRSSSDCYVLRNATNRITQAVLFVLLTFFCQ